MEEKEFRELLLRAAQGNLNTHEQEKLEGLVQETELANADQSDIEKLQKEVTGNILFRLKKQKRSAVRREFLRYAAAILFVLAAGTIFWQYNKNNTTTQVANVEIVTGKGQRRTIILPDSSVVVMNSESKLVYPERFKTKNRLVALSGEAFFKVYRNEEKPFIVTSGKIATTVLGTSFNIQESKDDITVTVSSGKVMVTKSGTKESVFLEKNQQTIFSYATGKFKNQQAASELFTDWSRGILNLDNINMEQVIKKMENWYNVTIECSSAGILAQNIKAKYDNEPIDYILQDIEFILGINYTYINDSTIVIEE